MVKQIRFRGIVVIGLAGLTWVALALAAAPTQVEEITTTRNPRTNEKACTRQAFEFGRELLRGPRYGKFFCMKSFLFFSS